MTSYEIVQRLRAGQTLIMRGRGSRDEEATFAALYERGLLHIERGYSVLAIRMKRRRLVRVRVVTPTWYGWRVSTQVTEVWE
jgi:hypothetical protein